MRDIWFRGSRLDNGQFVVGCLMRYSDAMAYITVDMVENIVHRVDARTVGQFTGLHDKNGVEIYEDDVVEFYYPDDYMPAHLAGTVIWTGRCFYDQTRCAFEIHATLRGGGFYHGVTLSKCPLYAVIGNIHESPELLK